MMTDKEFRALRTWELTVRRRFRPVGRKPSRRSAKHPSTGKVYKTSRVIPQVGLERVFNKPGWVRAEQQSRQR